MPMTTANKLTLARVALIPVFLVISYVQLPGYRYWALGVYVIACITDLLDGYIARKYHYVSDFGALMDPLADKIWVTGTMLIAIEYRLMPAFIAVLVLSREFMVTGLRTLAAKKQIVMSADRWGKLKTVLQMIMLAIAGFAWAMDGGTDYLREAKWFGIRIWYIWITYLWGVVLITVLSGIGYFVRYRSVYLPGKEPEK